MLAIKIDNPEIEQRFREYVKSQKKSYKEVASEAMKLFLDIRTENTELKYTKRDPKKHLTTPKRDYDDEFCDDVALSHITDSAKYVHDLRRKQKYE